ncbi:pentapeptide repeat-containing protein, partial [Cellulomonas hominis]
MTTTAVPHLTVVGPAYAQSVLADPQDRRGAVDATNYPVATTNEQVRAWVRLRAHRRQSLACVRLQYADLSGLNLSGAELTRADLFGASASGSRLTAADLTGAEMALMDLRGADLTAATLRGANLMGARIDETTVLDWIDWDRHTVWPAGLTPPAP